MKKLGLMIILVALVGYGSAQAQRSPLPKTAATLIYEVNKSNGGCPGRTDPLDWYMNNLSDGKGWYCVNGTWVESTPMPQSVKANLIPQQAYQSEPIPAGFRIPVQRPDEKVVFKNTQGRRFYILLRGTPPTINGKPLEFHPELLFKQLMDWGFNQKDFELHISWVSGEEFCTHSGGSLTGCNSFFAFGGAVNPSFGAYSESIWLRVGTVPKDQLLDIYPTLPEFYSYGLTLESRRIIIQQNGGDWALDVEDSELYRDYGWKASKYQYFSQ